MNRIVVLDNAAHRHVRVDTHKVLSEAARLRMVPVVLGEFLRLCVQYPIALTKNGDTGQFTCVALFGFDKHENLFWTDDRWDASYVPLQIVRQPFFLGTDDNAADAAQRMLVCIDTQSAGVQKEHGEALFDEHGNETAHMKNARQALGALLSGEEPTARFVRKLLVLNLVQPLRLQIEFANHQSQRIEGLYTVDEQRLNSLPGEPLIELHSLGYLGPIYTLLASLGNFHSLVQKKNAQLARAG